MGSKLGGESVDDVRHNEAILPILLEAALPIAILALLALYRHTMAGCYLHRFHTLYQILCLNAIGTNVLDGTCTHLTRDEREVLGTIPATLHTECDEVVPCLTAAHAHQDIILFYSHEFHTLNGRMQHRAVKVGSQQQIAATAQ